MRKLQGLIQNPQESPLPNGRAFAPSGIESHRKLDWGGEFIANSFREKQARQLAASRRHFLCKPGRRLVNLRGRQAPSPDCGLELRSNFPSPTQAQGRAIA